ncbi:MAG: polysaccharide deacetylase family protein [Proteobacteria bacterium]|nr:polysaccharide deacetylase family protein [Pseudomonadota bacterium]
MKNRFRQGISFIRRDEPALMTFLFHSIFRSEKEIELNHIDPQQFITLDIYRQFLDYFLEAGYQFISSRELLAGLDPEGRYLLATFDDGYYNNQHVLPLLQEYKVPALFFIATHNVLNNECFWWDVVYRELSRKGLNRKEISVAQKKYKKKTHEEIISSLKQEFGNNVMNPVSDIDRPFTTSELANFAADDFVDIGNHTSHHYILDGYPQEIQRDQMLACQTDLGEMLDIHPAIVSYPNGNYNEVTLKTAADIGFNFGITVDKRKNYLPLQQKDLTLGRFVLWGNNSLKLQCDIFRSDMPSLFRSHAK